MKYKIKPWLHQQAAIDVAKERNFYSLFHEMGTGKTGTAINILRHWWAPRRKIGRTIILCPPIVRRNWEREFDMHSMVPHDRIVVLDQSGKIRAALMKTLRESGTGQIVITNYEALLMDDLYNEMLLWEPEYIIFDESHKLKNFKSIRSKKAFKLANPQFQGKGKHQVILGHVTPPRKLLLTGTPILNDMMDIFQQYKILDGGLTFGHNYYAFKMRYFFDVNAVKRAQGAINCYPIWVPHKGAEEEINKKLKRSASHASKMDCLDIPPLTKQVISVTMSGAQKQMHHELKQDFITIMDKDIVAADLAIVKGLRLMQIVSGFYTTIKGEVVRYKDNPKLEALKELLSTHAKGHKILVWCVWKPNYEDIEKVCADLKLKSVAVHGGVSDKKKQEAVRAFNEEDDVRVLIGHPGSGGIGINLVAGGKCDISIFYSRTFSLEHSLQAEARNHRGGQTSKVTRIDLVCEHTIDEVVQQKLDLKIKIGNKVLKDISKQLTKGTQI